jgi:hypothetical protein
MIILTTEYVRSHKQELSYLNRDTWDDYFDATTLVIKSIYSSRLSSKVLDVTYIKEHERIQPGNHKDHVYGAPVRDANSAEQHRVKDNVAEGAFENFMFDGMFRLKQDYYNFGLKIENMIDCIYIVKSSQNEFNLKIRKLLNNWITKAFEILTKGERIILERNRISSRKNGREWY